MKKSFLLIFAVITCSLGFGQMNPVQNLNWYHTHIFPYNDIFSLSWQEPETPHSELIGYNIYRGNELYRFQTYTSLGCDSRWGINDGCDFLTHAFTVYVKAVYEGNIESEAVFYTINGPALSSKEFSSKSFTISPNPAKDIINFSDEVSDITITDLSGKITKQISKSEKSINISKLAKGTYLISTKLKSGELINKKFIKE